MNARTEDGSAIVCVSDTGIGVPRADQNDLFNRFFRASNVLQQAIPGTWPGLAIVRTIVISHDGDVSLQSQEGKARPSPCGCRSRPRRCAAHHSAPPPRRPAGHDGRMGLPAVTLGGHPPGPPAAAPAAGHGPAPPPAGQHGPAPPPAGQHGPPPPPPPAPVTVGGRCDRRFEPLRQAFAANFTERGEHGAAVCVIVDGIVVADLCGGWADAERHRPWRPDTLVNVFSVGKGLTAACVARLAGLGRLDMGAPVASYWPEFGTAGKGAITVAQLLSHQAGLPALRRRMPPGSMLRHRVMADALAAQDPWWEPGTAHGYHANTFGFLVGELVRRACGTTIGRMLAAEIAGPLGADVHIGLAAAEDVRVAEFLWAEPPPLQEPPAGPELMAYNAYFNPADLSGWGVVNTRAWRAAELPSANAHASARGIARVYAALAAGGVLAGVRVVDRAALAEAATERVYGPDVVLRRPSRFGLGFQLTQPERPLGPGAGAFGHFGAGGSVGFCDPQSGVAFGYVMGTMGPRWQNPRNRALIDAVYDSLH